MNLRCPHCRTNFRTPYILTPPPLVEELGTDIGHAFQSIEEVKGISTLEGYFIKKIENREDIYLLNKTKGNTLDLTLYKYDPKKDIYKANDTPYGVFAPNTLIQIVLGRPGFEGLKLIEIIGN